MATPQVRDTSLMWLRWSAKDALIHFDILKAPALEMEEGVRDPIEALKKESQEEPGRGNKLDEYNACMAAAEKTLKRIEEKDGKRYSTFDEIPENSLNYDEAFNLYKTSGGLANKLLVRTWCIEGGCNKNYGARWFLRHYMQTRTSADK